MEFTRGHKVAFTIATILAFSFLLACNKPAMPPGNAQVNTRDQSKMIPYPHPPKWALQENHGTTFAKASADERKQCLSCHSGEKPASGISCQQCHMAFPHSEEFQASHGETAKSSLGQCLNCHTDYKRNMPTIGETGCLTCHEGNLETHWVKAAAPEAPPSGHPAGSQPQGSHLQQKNTKRAFTSDMNKGKKNISSHRKPSSKE